MHVLTNASAISCMHACISLAVGVHLHTNLYCVWQLEADKLRADLEHAQAYRVKARQAKREVQELQQELDQFRAHAAEAAAAAASGEQDSFGSSVVAKFVCPSMSSRAICFLDAAGCTAAFEHNWDGLANHTLLVQAALQRTQLAAACSCSSMWFISTTSRQHAACAARSSAEPSAACGSSSAGCRALLHLTQPAGLPRWSRITCSCGGSWQTWRRLRP